MVTHQAFSNHLRIISEHFQVTSQDKVLQFSAYSFDQSIEQIFSTLISGATLFIRGPEIWTPEEFIRVIDEQMLTIVNIQPAYWLQWSQAAIKYNAITGQSLKLVIVGGDAILPEQLHLWSKTPMKHCRLLNAYGPTETTITASTFDLSLLDNEGSQIFRVPIGRALPNRRFYILDRWRQPVPVGVPGELYISGDCLAKGYLNQSSLTEERFLADPFTGQSSGRKMYRTGDQARFLPSGDVEFLGRVDTQVKIRGFRIELGEIETVLENYPLISEAVVLPREIHNRSVPGHGQVGTPSDKRLVAFLVINGSIENESQSLNDLRESLKTRLPAYMLPSAFVILETIPKTLSGKVDRKALNSLAIVDETQPVVGNAFVAPRSPVEEELARIWSEVLGVEKVGVFDNFFELGGHSLLATQLISRIRETYHVNLALKKLFESPTIDTISQVITQDLVEIIQKSEADNEIQQILAEIDSLSDDEIFKMLGDSQ
jgi:acyl-coenzyme A synthetase/AMP-(fatty) acid ligase/acyl carrier protein